jgi:cytochrome c oxidase subunit 3
MSRHPVLVAGAPAAFGMRLLIMSLSILFVAALAGYWITGRRLEPAMDVAIPGVMYGSTAALVAAALLLGASWQQLRRSASGPARSLLWPALAAAVAFLALQVPALLQLLEQHRAAVVQGRPLLGYVFFLVLLHAAHVAGGLVALAVLARRAARRPLIPDQDGPALRDCSRYWHFLDIVWLAMFAVFLVV